MTFNDVVESAAGKLSSDERLRSNLTDDEFTPILDWALARLDEKTAAAGDATTAKQIAHNEMKRIESVMTTLNESLSSSATPTLAAAATLLKLKLPKQKIEIRDRVSLIKEVLQLIEGEWGKSTK
jgi:hypothetical protein